MFGRIFGEVFLYECLGLTGDDEENTVTLSTYMETHNNWRDFVNNFPSTTKVQLATMFETSDVHPDIVDDMKIFHRVIVPFPFLRDVLISKGINCISLDTWTSSLIREKPLILARRPDPTAVRFLYVGTNDLRKNTLNLYKVCEDIFKGTKHRLIMKTNITDELKPSKNITVITGRSTNDYVASLYNWCDYVITFSRGEGVGMPILEANYFNKPIISHLGGVNMDVQKYINVPWYELPCKEIPVNLTNVPTYLHKVFYGNWWDVDETTAKKVIRDCIKFC